MARGILAAVAVAASLLTSVLVWYSVLTENPALMPLTMAAILHTMSIIAVIGFIGESR